jgi:hypothetical protein
MNGPVTAARQSGTRFMDSTGCEWQVYEWKRDDVDGHRLTLLVFESGRAVRCVRRYPPNWRELDASALQDLSWRT